MPSSLVRVLLGPAVAPASAGTFFDLGFLGVLLRTRNEDIKHEMTLPVPIFHKSDFATRDVKALLLRLSEMSAIIDVQLGVVDERVVYVVIL